MIRNAIGIGIVGLVLWFVLGGSTVVFGHDTGYGGHDTAHKFHSHFDELRQVYCGWRHGFEGISCVKVGD